MGQHTWFYKTKEFIEEEEEEIYEIITSDNYNSSHVHYLIREEYIDEQKQTEFHDCFRTSKREKNGEYCLDKIFSKEECDKWLKENSEYVYDLNQESLDKFWQKYPNGYIEFG